MKAGSSHQQVHVLIVGSSTDDFVRFTAKLVRGCEVDYSHCANVYSAASQLAANRCCNVLVIGRLENLNKEEGWIFRNTVEGKFSCCCFVEHGSAINRGQVTAARRAGVFIVNEMEEIEAVVMSAVRDAFACTTRIGKVKQAVFDEKKFGTTKAEMDALLGA